MPCVTKATLCFIFVASLVYFAGCRREPAPAPPAEPAPANEKAATDAAPADAPATGDQSQAAAIEAAFASLSAEDRALAMKQKICPVSEEPLGAMGTPMKVTVAGHDVFICCEHCKDPLVENPTEHLAKIGLEPAAETAVPQ